MEQLKERVVVSRKVTLSTINKEELYPGEEVKWQNAMIVLRKLDGPLKRVNSGPKRLAKVLRRENHALLVEDPKSVPRRNHRPADQSLVRLDAVVKHI
jgi:hypothetical protein